MTSNPLKWHGGKQYLARQIIAMMPAHTHYVEPYFGGGAVLLAKEYDGISEVANDVNGALINFWRVLQNEIAFAGLLRCVQATPLSEEMYCEAEAYLAKRVNWHVQIDVHAALAFFICCRQSRAATFKGFTTLAKTRVRCGMNELPSAWWNAIDGLPEVHDRLARVVILCRDALECIRTQDGAGTLFYLDPPYLHSTRVATSAYQYEMSSEQHLALLEVLGVVRGKFLLSGYPAIRRICIAMPRSDTDGIGKISSCRIMRPAEIASRLKLNAFGVISRPCLHLKI